MSIVFSRQSAALFVIAAASFLGACACTPKGGGSSEGGGSPQGSGGGEITALATVNVSADGAGGYTFSYDSPFADSGGNFDFSQGEAAKKSVLIKFKIGQGPAGLKFQSPGENALWIVEKEMVGDGSPQGPYEGKQFLRFETSADGQNLQVFDLNSDGVKYRYALRFDLNGETIAHDPDIRNGNSSGGGN
jgi:hypothetical protein